MVRPSTANQAELLDFLIAGVWLAPLELGGTDGSHHSRTLAQLVRKGLVERQRRNTLANFLRSARGSYEYRITEAGLAARRAKRTNHGRAGRAGKR